MKRKLYSMAGAVLLLAMTGCAQEDPNKQTLILTVKWSPDRNSGNEIRVITTVGGLTLKREYDTISPWSDRVNIFEGTEVRIDVTMRKIDINIGGSVECFIHQDNKQLVHERMKGTGVLSCRLNKLPSQ